MKVPTTNANRNLSGKLEVAANAATIVLVLLAGMLLLRNNATSARTRVPARTPPIQVGAHWGNSPLGINWGANHRTLVMGLQTTCHFCTQSGPFFQRLVEAAPSDLKIVAVFPQAEGVAKSYLDNLGVRVNEIKQASLAMLGIAGTPTLLLVDDLGVVKDVWSGEQAPEGEASVLSAIQDPSTANDPPGTRRVRLNSKEPDDPARIVVVKEGNMDVTPGVRPYKSWEGKPFQADDDWVKNLTFVVKNLSKKEIVAASLDVIFPETGTGSWASPVYGPDISLGRRPARYVRVGGTDQKELRPAETTPPLHILPGQEMTISFAQHYDQITEAVEQQPHPIANLTICTVQLVGVYFSDGTMWAQGTQFERADPNAPGKYVRISADEFWGRTPTGTK